MSVEIYPEIHCDDCNDVIHNHIMLCPSCQTHHAGTDAYCELHEGDEFSCESCGAKFKMTGWDEAELV
jgi:hypothetical protein